MKSAIHLFLPTIGQVKRFAVLLTSSLICTFTALSYTSRGQTIDPYKTILLPDSTALEMVYIPAGTYMMGSPTDELSRHNDEGPLRKVTISKGFYLGKYELTQAQWKAITGSNPSVFRNVQQAEDHPVDNVSWNDAHDYIAKLNTLNLGAFRLPTEAEWEYACRAGTSTRYYWGADSSDQQVYNYAWAFPQSEGRSHPVGLKKPNAWNLYDMCGNVWEWCQDWRTSSYSTSDTVDPTGTPVGTKKIYRGGSWFNKPSTLRSANRNGHPPDTGGGANSGFRLLMEIK